MSNFNDAITIYKELAKIPELSSAHIVSATDTCVVLNSTWYQRLLTKQEQQTIHLSHTLASESFKQLSISGPYLNDDGLWKVRSPSGKWLMYVRKTKADKDKNNTDKYYFELWSSTGHCEKIIDVSALEKHEEVYDSDGSFGSLVWNKSETKVAYVAEKKKVKPISYFEEKKKTCGEVAVGDKFLYQEDWGEQLVGKRHPVICVLDIASEDVSVIEQDNNDLSSGQIVWCPDDRSIVFCGFIHSPMRLGITHCPVRRSNLYHYDLETMTSTVLNENSECSVRSPRFSPDGKTLVYLECRAGGPHAKCLKVQMIDWNAKAKDTLVDVVNKSNASDEFHGLYTPVLATRCWSADSTHVFISTSARSRRDVFAVDIRTKQIRRLSGMVGSWSVIDVHNNVVVAKYSCLDVAPRLAIGRVSGVNGTRSIDWAYLGEEHRVAGIDWEVLLHKPTKPDVNYPDLTFETVVMRPTDGNVKALVVFPHGGPHSVFTAEYQIYWAGLAKAGFAIALINYRGSTGFGDDSINSLCGRIGESDVEDVQQAAEEILDKYNFDRSKVVALGGSHGGFLVAHLSGRYPDFYKAIVMRNPVTNMVAMTAITDIPDWCYFEAGLEYKPGAIPTDEAYSLMYRKSAVCNIEKIKTPTMVMLGQDDKRVPPCLGIQYYKALVSRGVEARLMVYPNNSHPIRTVEAESDSFVNLYKWFVEHTS